MAGSLPIIETMRAMVPAKDFEISKRFYLELGFSPQTLSDRLIAMHFGNPLIHPTGLLRRGVGK